MTARWHDAGAAAGIASEDPVSTRITGRFPGLSGAAGAPPDTGGKCALADHSPTEGCFMMNAAMERPEQQGQLCSHAGKTAVEPIFGTLHVGGARVVNPPIIVRV